MAMHFWSCFFFLPPDAAKREQDIKLFCNAVHISAILQCFVWNMDYETGLCGHGPVVIAWDSQAFTPTTTFELGTQAWPDKSTCGLWESNHPL